MIRMLVPLAAIVPFAAFAEADGVVVANGGFESLGPDGWVEGWTRHGGRDSWRVLPGMGVDGSTALVWERAAAEERQSRVTSELHLKTGSIYVLEADLFVEGTLKGPYGKGATVYFERFDKDGKWLGGTYTEEIKSTGGGWRRMTAVSAPIRANVSRIVAGLQVSKGCTGKVRFDNFCIREFELGSVRDPALVPYRYAPEKANADRCVWIDSQRRARVGGKPFFPLGTYGGVGKKDISRFKGGPFNTIMAYGAPDCDALDRAAANGMKVISGVNHVFADSSVAPKGVKTQGDERAWLERYVKSVKDHPALLAWYAADEAPVTKLPQLVARRDLLEELDPEHPVWWVMNNTALARHYLPSFDVAGADPYPVYDGADISGSARWTRETVQGCGGNRAAWIVPQIFSWAHYNRKGSVPTREEIRNQTWQCIAEGATGIIYFKYGDLHNNADTGLSFEERWADVTNVAWEVRREFPFLLSGETAPAVSGTNETLCARAFVKGGKVRLLVVNASREPCRAKVQVERTGYPAYEAELAPLEVRFVDLPCRGAAARANDPYDYKELVTREVLPARISANAVGRKVADFGKDAVGWLELDGPASGPYEIVLGELVNSRGEVTNEYPRSTIRCRRLAGVKPAGKFRVPMPADRINLKGYDPKAPAIRLPERFGVVFPFRYAEIVKGPEMTLRQFAVNYPIDMGKSAFDCDSADLVRVYEFCKYSMLATSFCGVYVDGDRERTPYEADAYINQLGHYAIDDDCSLARKSHEWLMEHPTWPTEWKQHSIMMAWADWMWTGDTRSIAKYYGMLAGEKLLLEFARPSDGLLETGGERGKGAKPGAGDIVDWPDAERDGFVFRPVNAVVNAFFYRNLLEMADISRALGKGDRAAEFADMAQKVRAAFQGAFYRPSAGLYADGEGTDHCSLHANAAALAFGLVPEGRVPAVADFLERKGMACSVYFAQYLLEALFQAGRADAATRLMTSHGDRSWIGMMDFGSTISMEAWNVVAKPNLDLNHAWGAAPLNVISRYVVGVTPLEPGFAKVAIRPQIGGLRRLSATVPTAKGPVTLKVAPGRLDFSSPVEAEVTFEGETRTFPPGSHSLR